MPWMAASLPGQDQVAVRTPAFSAPTQIGSPPHQRASVTASGLLSRNVPRSSACMLLWMMPW
ncbi:hypothetical protein D3C87_579170 [compost metagenome]